MIVTIAAAWLLAVVVLAIAADWLPLSDPSVDVGDARLAPFHSWSEPLGTDRLGRSVLARLVFGARVSLAVGLFAALLGLLLGGMIGVVAGYTRRVFDELSGLCTDALLAFPPLVLLLALSTAFDPSVRTLIVGLTLVSAPAFVRLSRANTLRFANREFVRSAKLIGARPSRIIWREVVPNVFPTLISYAVVVLASLVVVEASLSFLGLGVPPPTASWGTMIADGQSSLANHPSLVLVPLTVLFLTVFSMNIVGDYARSRFDPNAKI